MPGARSVISRNPPEKIFEPKARRHGSVSNAEQSLINQFVLDQPREVTTAQVTALSKVLRRSKDAVKDMVARAREEFQASADFYVSAHKQSVERALGVTNPLGQYDPKALDVAARASQWALENLSAEGQRIVDKPDAKGNSGPRIMVGIQLGGMNTPVPAVNVVEITSESEAKVPPSF